MPSISANLNEQLCQAHQSLMSDLRDLLAETGDMPMAVLHSRLLRTKRDLIEHFRLEEEGNYLQSLRTKEPNLSKAIDKLIGEHRELLESLDEILADLNQPEPHLSDVRENTSYPSGTTVTCGWWQTQTLSGRDSGSGSALDRDANITTDGTFLVDVPNGRYQVDMHLGELHNAHDRTGVFLEGVQVDNVTASSYFGIVTRSFTVTVVDGQ